jgi:hypothetical protein
VAILEIEKLLIYAHMQANIKILMLHKNILGNSKALDVNKILLA